MHVEGPCASTSDLFHQREGSSVSRSDKKHFHLTQWKSFFCCFLNRNEGLFIREETGWQGQFDKFINKSVVRTT